MVSKSSFFILPKLPLANTEWNGTISGSSVSWNVPRQQTTITSKTMGDKSPKSKQKDKNQKQGKADASRQAKQRAISNKQQDRGAVPAKKK